MLTDTGRDNWANDGDEARCAECKCPGSVTVCEEPDASINWHDELDCDCEWCVANPPNAKSEGSPLHKHEYDRKLTPKERKEIASAFGWADVDGVRDNLIGMRPMYDSAGKHYSWMDEQHVPDFSYDTLRFVRQANAGTQRPGTQDAESATRTPMPGSLK